MGLLCSGPNFWNAEEKAIPKAVSFHKFNLTRPNLEYYLSFSWQPTRSCEVIKTLEVNCKILDKCLLSLGQKLSPLEASKKVNTRALVKDKSHSGTQKHYKDNQLSQVP